MEIGPQEKIRNIEALLKEAETLQDTARQREYTQRITELISEAKNNFLAIEARHGDDIGTTELDTLWALLDYASLKNPIYINIMAPYKKKTRHPHI